MTVRSTALVGLALGLAGCATAGPGPSASLATASVTRSDGSPSGTATILSERGATVLRVAVNGLPPGPHGIHLHAVGKCEGPNFTSASGHLNPTNRQHGTLNPQGSHVGDLPNLDVGADGSGSLEFRVNHDPAMVRGVLFDADGTSLVIHANSDDYRSDPSGNSGGRIACGVFAPG